MAISITIQSHEEIKIAGLKEYSALIMYLQDYGMGIVRSIDDKFTICDTKQN